MIVNTDLQVKKRKLELLKTELEGIMKKAPDGTLYISREEFNKLKEANKENYSYEREITISQIRFAMRDFKIPIKNDSEFEIEKEKSESTPRLLVKVPYRSKMNDKERIEQIEFYESELSGIMKKTKAGTRYISLEEFNKLKKSNLENYSSEKEILLQEINAVIRELNIPLLSDEQIEKSEESPIQKSEEQRGDNFERRPRTEVQIVPPRRKIKVPYRSKMTDKEKEEHLEFYESELSGIMKKTKEGTRYISLEEFNKLKRSNSENYSIEKEILLQETNAVMSELNIPLLSDEQAIEYENRIKEEARLQEEQRRAEQLRIEYEAKLAQEKAEKEKRERAEFLKMKEYSTRRLEAMKKGRIVELPRSIMEEYSLDKRMKTPYISGDECLKQTMPNQFVLTNEETLEKFKLYKITNDPKIREQIIVGNMRLVEYIAEKFAQFYEIDQEELLQDGYEALIEAVDNFNIKDNKFSTHACSYIKKKLLDIIPKTINSTSNKIAYAYLKAKKAVEEMNDIVLEEHPEYFEDVVDIMIAQGVIKPYDKNEYLEYVQTENAKASNYWIDDDVELVSDFDVDIKATKNILRSKIIKLLDCLTPKEKQVIGLRFGLIDGQARTLEEVGKAFNVKRERIRQIEAKALRKLRGAEKRNTIKDFMENYDDINYYKNERLLEPHTEISTYDDFDYEHMIDSEQEDTIRFTR